MAIRVKVSVASVSFRFGFGGISDRLRLVSVDRLKRTDQLESISTGQRGATVEQNCLNGSNREKAEEVELGLSKLLIEDSSFEWYRRCIIGIELILFMQMQLNKTNLTLDF